MLSGHRQSRRSLASLSISKDGQPLEREAPQPRHVADGQARTLTEPVAPDLPASFPRRHRHVRFGFFSARHDVYASVAAISEMAQQKPPGSTAFCAFLDQLTLI